MFTYPIHGGSGIPASLKSGMISYWTMDETSGTRADSHGPNDLKDDSAITPAGYTAGKVGNACVYYTNTAMERLTPPPTILAGANDWSIAGWINLDVTNIATQAMVGYSKTAVVATPHLDWMVAHESASNRFILHLYVVSADNTVSADTFGAPSATTWYFIYAQHDSTGLEIGISVNNGTLDTNTYTGVPNNNAERFQTGRLSPQFPVFLDGMTDELGFWNRPLTSPELAALYNGGSGITYTDIP